MSVIRIVDRIRARRRFRITVEQLTKLSDHQLQDIGIARYEIADRARSRA